MTFALERNEAESTSEASVEPVYWVYQDGGRRWRWFLLDHQRRKIATSGRGYSTKEECLASIDLVRNLAGARLREV
jgi:uncharacterized protein YegP (UPF0339 family)